MHLLRGVRRAVIHDHRVALFGRRRSGSERGAASVRREPGQECRRFKPEVDESRSGHGNLEKRGEIVQLRDESQGDTARVLALLSCIGKNAVRLEVPVDGVRGPDSGGKAGCRESGAAGGGREGAVEGRDKIEAEIHPATQRSGRNRRKRVIDRRLSQTSWLD